MSNGPTSAVLEMSSSFNVSVAKDKKKSFNAAKTAEISVRDFLDFLKTAYQVNESIEGIVSDLVDKKSVDWNDLANNKLMQEISDIIETVENQNSPRVDAEVQTEQKDKKNENQSSSTTSFKKERKNSLANIRRKSLVIKQEGNVFQATSSSASQCASSAIKEKLNEVLSEGLLDSVLPYLIPSTAHQPVIRKNTTDIKKQNSGEKLEKDKSNTSVITNQSNKSIRRKSTIDVSSSISKSSIKPDAEVEIHVCDEVKHIKKDFRCPQNLLTSKMGYFAEVTAGQKLEDMDISVHCDIGIFDWLMRWVKKDSMLQEDWPKLDPQCVVPVLVSAAFLQMEPLLQDCLLFCHGYMNEIVRTSTNLACLNDNVITRLAAMYTNSELETIRDKKDKILSRLYCKMILSLGEPVSQSLRGHWASLAGLYRCSKCGKLVTKREGVDVPCIASCMRVDIYGDVVSYHIRDVSWSLSEYIVQLHRELKTWRRVYWRLWGACHFLRCLECSTMFPAHQIAWCCHHAEPAQFFTMDNQRATPIPVGRYPCCGERAYRFEPLTNPTGGCQFREHMVDITFPRDAAIMTIFNQHRNVIEQEPPQLMIPERLTRLVAREVDGDSNLFSNKEVFWWEGIELAPPRQRLGLLGKMCFNPQANIFKEMRLSKSPNSSVETDSDEDIVHDENDLDSASSSSSSDQCSEESSPTSSPRHVKSIKRQRTRFCRKRRRTFKKKTVTGRHWSPNLSARSNQDLQRDFEENAMQQIVEFLSRRTAGTDVLVQHYTHKQLANIWNHHVTPSGGLYTRLEAEWCETNKQQITNSQMSNRSNRNVNAISYLVRPKFRLHR